MRPRLFNSLWLRSQRRAHRAFQQQLGRSEAVQEAILLRYLRDNADTDVGRRYGFAKLRSYEDYRAAVPVTEDFAELEGDIELMAQGRPDVLFKGRPLFFETTSGSTASAKRIPYNTRLKSEFQTAVAVWMNDLYRHCPQAFRGASYWSLSPATKEPTHTAGGIPVGTSTDADYFNPLTAHLLRQIFATPPGLAAIRDPHQFYVQTWQHLLARPDLSFVSVWSPNFLLNMDKFLRANAGEILDTSLLPRPRRKAVAALLGQEAKWEHLFPRLSMLSCWTQAQAALWLPAVRALLGDVPIQGKGLLSTEGVASIPYGLDRQLMSYTAQFYEFRSLGGQQIWRSHELSVGEVYELILSTGGGLYRYHTKDLVRCEGFQHSVPFLTFMGRGTAVSDMVGEKLSESSLHELFASLVARYPLKSLFLRAIRPNEHQGAYLLLVDASAHLPLQGILHEVEQHLCQNPYYQQALHIGQLLPLSVQEVSPGFSDTLFERYQQARCIKDGDVKLPLLWKLEDF